MSDSDKKNPQNVNMSRKSAVALSYKESNDAAPRIVAKGRGEIARKIIEAAKANGVYVHESPELVSLLMQVDLDACIPPKLYVVVAELLAWLYHLERDREFSTHYTAAVDRNSAEISNTVGPPEAENAEN